MKILKEKIESGEIKCACNEQGKCGKHYHVKSEQKTNWNNEPCNNKDCDMCYPKQEVSDIIKEFRDRTIFCVGHPIKECNGWRKNGRCEFFEMFEQFILQSYQAGKEEGKREVKSEIEKLPKFIHESNHFSDSNILTKYVKFEDLLTLLDSKQ